MKRTLHLSTLVGLAAALVVSIAFLAAPGSAGATPSGRDAANAGPLPLVIACQRTANGFLYTTPSVAACPAPWKLVVFTSAAPVRICVHPGYWIWKPATNTTPCTARTEPGGYVPMTVPAATDKHFCAPTPAPWPIRYVVPTGSSAIDTKNCYPGGKAMVIAHANHAPTNITLTHSTVQAGQPAGTVVGNLSTTDADAGDTHTYSLVPGAGSTNNASFQIVGNQLRTSAPLGAGTKSVRIRTNDGHGGTFEKAFTIAVTPVAPPNHAPTDIALSNQSVAENQPSGTTVGTLSTTDADAGDTFTYSLVSGVGSTDNASFTIVGNQLRTAASFDFETKSSYSIRIRTNDGHGGTYEEAFTITVTNANEAPVVTTSGGNTAYTEGDPGTAVDGSLTVSDADSASLASAQVRVSSGFQSGDQLDYVDQNGITGTYDTGTGVLTLAGSSSVANYQTALRSIQFRTSNDNPSASKTVEFKVNDGALDSNAATKVVTVTGANDAPTLTASGGSASYTEGGSAAAVDSGITVSDPDSANLQGGTVSITANFSSADGDSLNFVDQNGIHGVYNSGTGVLTLTGSASVEDYQTGLRSITFSNTSNNPSTSTRTVSFQVTDSGAAPSNVATRDVTVAVSNDAPVVSTSSGNTAYTEGGAAVAVDSSLTVTDADDTSLEGATVRISSNFQSGDVLGFTNQNGITGSYDSGTGVLTLAGTSTVANYQTALRSVDFDSTNANPSAAKTVEFKANDGDADSNAATKGIAITAANDAPTVTTSGGSASYTEGGSAATVDPGVTVSDPDSANLQGGTVSITANFSSADGDSLNFVDQNGIHGVYNSGTGVLTLTGSASVADYQTGLRSITFSNTSNNPSTSTRTVSFKVTDTGSADSNTATRDVTVATSNDAPAVTTSGGNTAYTEGQAATAVDSGLTVSDADDSNLESALVSVSADFQSGDDLQFVDQNGITGSYNSGTGVLTLTGTSSVANYQTALRSVAFFTPTTNTATTKTIEFEVNDGDVDSNAPTKTIDITPANAAPVANPDTFNGASRAIGNTSLVVDHDPGSAPDPAGPQKTINGNLLTNDTDADGPGPLVLTAETKATTDGGSVTIEDDGDFTFHPKATTSCTDHSDSFTYTVSDQNTPTAGTGIGTATIDVQDCVWYVDASASPGGDGTSGTPYNTITATNLAGAGGVGDQDGTGQKIFLYSGTYTAGLPLENSQSLFSQRHGLVVPDGGGGAGTVTLVAAGGTNATLSGGSGLALASGNSVQGIDFGTTATAAQFALSGASVGTAHVDDTTSGTINNTAGGAVSISGTGNDLQMAFDALSSAGSTTNAITIANATGTFTGGCTLPCSAGSIGSATTTDVVLNGGSLAFTLNATLSDDTGQLVSISGQTSGTKDFNGPVNDDAIPNNGGGVSLSSNTGATIRFDGGLKLSTGSTNAFAATGGGTIAIPDPAGSPVNTIATTTGTALNVSDTIHSDGLTFESISSNGAANGIVLSGTGSAGGLTVTGAATVNGCSPADFSGCTGGTIQSSVGAGVSLTNVGGGVSLTRMRIANGSDDGVRAVSASNLTLATDTITLNGNNVGENGLDANGQTGTVSISDTAITGSADTNADVFSGSSGTLVVTVTNSTFSNSSASTGSDGLHVDSDGSTNATVSVTGSTFTHNRGDQFQFATDSAASGTNTVTFTGNTLTGDRGTTFGGTDLGGGITLSTDASSTTNYTISSNTMQGAVADGILIDLGASSTASGVLAGTISGNSVGIAATVDSGSAQFDDIGIVTDGAGSNRATISNNNLVQYGNSKGIRVHGRNGTNHVDVKITGNTISAPGTFGASGLFFQAGSSATDNTTMCADIGGAGIAQNNVSASGASSTDIRFFEAGASSSIRLPGYAGSPTDTTAVSAFVVSKNSGDGVPTVSFGPVTAGFPGGAACNTP